MGNKPFFRQQLLIDKELQFHILAFCWFVVLVWVGFTMVFIIAWSSLDPAEQGTHYIKGVLIFGAVFTFAATFLITFSVTNRIAGPIYRLRQEIKRINEGNAPRTLVVRKGDMLHDLYAEYNQLVSKQLESNQQK